MNSRLRWIGVVGFVLLTGCASEVTLSVPDMMCEEGCAAKVREVLSEQPGVKQVRVDFPNRTATLGVNKAKFDVEQAVAVLVDHGFEHSRLKTETQNPAADVSR
ncbi:MAG: heavy-metal-associated domain-containing protein [Pirellulales bacterium]